MKISLFILKPFIEFVTYLTGYDLLQRVLTFSVSVVSHDDHDDWHEFIHQCQWAVFKLSRQDSFWMHVRDFFDFLHSMKMTWRQKKKMYFI